MRPLKSMVLPGLARQSAMRATGIGAGLFCGAVPAEMPASMPPLAVGLPPEE
ncbi:hypothetical protein D3C72_2191060 [compost metagenome]